MASNGNAVFQVIAGLAILSIVFQISTSECFQDWLRQLLVAPTKSSSSLEHCYAAPSEFLHLRECRKWWLWQRSLLESLTRSRNTLLLQPGYVEKNQGPVATANAETQLKRASFWPWPMWTRTASFSTLTTLLPLHLLNAPTSLPSQKPSWTPQLPTMKSILLATTFSGLILIILVVVLLCIVVIIFHAPCLVAVLFLLVSNPCEYLWELAASILFLPSAAFFTEPNWYNR